MAFCRHCGANLNEAAGFCPSCGAAVAAAAPPAPAMPPGPVPAAPSMPPVAPPPPGYPAGYAAPPRSPKAGGKGAIIAVVSLLVAAALGVGGYFLWQSQADDDGRSTKKDDEKTGEVDVEAQARAAAEFYAGWYIEDPEILKGALSEDLEDSIDDLGLVRWGDQELEYEWEDDVLTLTVYWEGDVELVVTLESDGDPDEATVEMVPEADYEDWGERTFTLELEGDRWIITEVDGDPVSLFIDQTLGWTDEDEDSDWDEDSEDGLILSGMPVLLDFYTDW